MSIGYKMTNGLSLRETWMTRSVYLYFCYFLLKHTEKWVVKKKFLFLKKMRLWLMPWCIHYKLTNYFSFVTGNRLVPVRSSQSPIVAQDMLSHNALSPSFHPSLSPLATKSPSVSPMSVPLKRDLGPPRIGRGPLQ